MVDSGDLQERKPEAKVLTESGGIPGRQKVAHGSNVPALTSHASPNPRSKSGYEPERRVIKKDGPEARTRAEDDLELDCQNTTHPRVCGL